MGIQEEKKTQRALICMGRDKSSRGFDMHGREKTQRASIYTGYYYDTYGIGTPW